MISVVILGSILGYSLYKVYKLCYDSSRKFIINKKKYVKTDIEEV